MTEKILEESLISQFQSFLAAEEKSQATVEKYVRDVTALSRYLDGRAVTKDLLVDYKQNLMVRGYAVRSVNSMIASINSLLDYLGQSDWKLKALKIQQKAFCTEDKELTKEEYFRLCRAAQKQCNERLSLLLQTICGTGIRVSELPFFTVEAVRQGLVTVSLKGKTRDVFIVKSLQKKLLRYAEAKKIKSGCIFLTRNGNPISRTNVWRSMKSLCKAANVDPTKVYPHNLRHLFARVFYGMDKDIAQLADILGHSSINTTRIYIVSTGSEHRKRMENMRLIL